MFYPKEEQAGARKPQPTRPSASPMRPAGSAVAQNGGTPSQAPTPPGVQQQPGDGQDQSLTGQQPLSIPTHPAPQPQPAAPPPIGHVPPTVQPPSPLRAFGAAKQRVGQLQTAVQTGTAPPPRPGAAPTPTANVPLSQNGLGPITPAAMPPSVAPPTSATAMPAGVTPIDPSNDLRNKTIAPGAADPRLTDRQQMSDAALKDVAKVDRYELAKSKFDEFAKSTEGDYLLNNRLATQRAAAGGRLGSGMLRTDYGNLDLARSRDLQGARDRFLNEALEGSIADSFGKSRVLQDAEGDLVSRGRADRDELRGERGYENELENQAFGRRRQQMLDENMLTDSSFDRDMRRAEFADRGNPGYAEMEAGNRRRASADMDAESMGELWNQIGQNAGGGPPPAGSGGGGWGGMSQQQIDDFLRNAGTPNGAAPTSDEGPPVIVGSANAIPQTQAEYAKRGLVWAPGTRSHGMPRN